MKNIVVQNYIDVLIGKTPEIDVSNFYGAAASEANQNIALYCIQFAIEEILQWNEETAIRGFDEYIIHFMKLDRIVKYICFPLDVPEGSPKYILSLLYPDSIQLNRKKLIQQMFLNVLEARKSDNENVPDNQSRQFPREYFSGVEGFKRFCVCLNFLIENYHPMSSVYEVYQFFDSPRGNKFLCDYRLKVPADQFSIDILDVVHCITCSYPESDILFSYFRLKKIYKLAAREFIQKERARKEKEKKKENDQNCEE